MAFPDPKEWLTHEDGEWSELILPGLRAIVSQPEGNGSDNWSAIVFHVSGGKSLSLASGKVDAVMALRRDIERLAEALGGTVKWKVADE